MKNYVNIMFRGAKDAMNTGIRDLNYWLWLQVNKVAADIRERYANVAYSNRKHVCVVAMISVFSFLGRLLDTKPKLNDDELHLIVLDIKHRMDIKPQGASIRK